MKVSHDAFCICGHQSMEHSKMNGKAFARLNRQIDGYKDTPKAREKFWKKYLDNMDISEFACYSCVCHSFKLDNLRYLEDKLQGRENGQD